MGKHGASSDASPAPEQSAQSGGQNDLSQKLLNDVQNGARDLAMIGSGLTRTVQGVGMVGLGIGRSVYDLQVLPPLQIVESVISVFNHTNRTDDHRNGNGNRSEEHRNGNGNRSEEHRNGNGNRSEEHRNGNGNRSEEHRNGNGNRSEEHRNRSTNRSEVQANQKSDEFKFDFQHGPYNENSKHKDFEHTGVWSKGGYQVWQDNDRSTREIGYTWKDTDGHYRGWKLNPDAHDGEKGRWVLYDGSKVLGTATDVQMTSEGLKVDGKLQDLSKPTTHGPQ